jgi:hypothetical protein
VENLLPGGAYVQEELTTFVADDEEEERKMMKQLESKKQDRLCKKKFLGFRMEVCMPVMWGSREQATRICGR